MDDNALHGNSGLFPELATGEPALPHWEVTFRVRRRDGEEPLKLLGVPSGGRAIACWTAAEGVAVAIVDAADEMAARAAGALACPGWAKLPYVTVTVEWRPSCLSFASRRSEPKAHLWKLAEMHETS